MSELQASHPPTPADVRALLTTIARFLRHARRLGPEAQLVLADLLEEIGRALEENDVSAAEIARLTECTSHLLDAVHDEEPGILDGVRERLDRAVVAVETTSPTLAGLTRRFAQMLSDIGI